LKIKELASKNINYSLKDASIIVPLKAQGASIPLKKLEIDSGLMREYR
jgi:hypothetical protein